MNTSEEAILAAQDRQYLNILSIFHYVVGGILFLFSLFPFIYVGIGIMVLVAPESMADRGKTPPVGMGIFFIVLGAIFILGGLACSICTIISGRWLRQQKRKIFSLVTAGILCMFMPLGTVLGVFTIIVLCRNSVGRLYELNAAKNASVPAPLS